jgi:3'-phosphoadenosine 5'-phosphosulfate sulfotransferase (PAPS reductase)/FAD synthetase
MNRIGELVTKAELNVATAQVIEDITATTKGKRAAYAWSGGKDSLVLAHICQQAGITDCVFGHTELEYPEFLAWCMANLPEGCEVINTGQNLDWLAKRPEMLFPQNSTLISRWFAIVQRAAIQRYFSAHTLDVILAGHRKADGNYVGKGSNIFSNGAGVTRYSPLADWPHEMLLAYIHYNSVPLPPIYGWKDGYRCGTHPWPSRMGMKSIEQGWAEVYEIDPTIVTGAAEKLASAARFLEGVGV